VTTRQSELKCHQGKENDTSGAGCVWERGTEGSRLQFSEERRGNEIGAGRRRQGTKHRLLFASFFLRLNQRPDFLKLQGDLQSDHADASGGRCGSVGRR